MENRDQTVEVSGDGKGGRGAGVAFLEGPPWWEAMSGGQGGDVGSNNEDQKCGRSDRAQNEVGLRNVGGGEERSGSMVYELTFFFFFLNQVRLLY